MKVCPLIIMLDECRQVQMLRGCVLDFEGYDFGALRIII